MAVYQFLSDDFYQLAPEAILARLARWTGVWRSVEAKRLRFILRAVPMSLERAVHRARQAEATAPDEQALRHIRQYTGALQAISQGGVLTFEHYLITPKDDPGVVGSLARGMGLQAAPVPNLPPLLPARYKILSDKLVPESGVHPFFSVLVSYELSGSWQWTTLANVLSIGFPVDVAIDIITYPGAATHSELDKAQTVLHGVTLQVGAKAALAKQTADYNTLAHAAQSGEILHEVTLGFLVRGSTEAELRQREQLVKTTLTGFASLHRYDGLQKDALDTLFSPDSGSASKLPGDLWHNLTSRGLATILGGGLGVRRYGDTGGVFWGFSWQSPFFRDGFGPNLTEPNHGVIFGKTGAGKTFTVNVIALREMNLMGSQIIIMEPLGHCKRLARALGEKRASYNPLSTKSLRINPVERLYEDDTSQAAHLAIIVQLLLDRQPDVEERIAIDAAAPLIYDGVSVDTPAVNQPRIENLVQALRSLSGEPWMERAGQYVGSQLLQKCVYGTYGRNFNVATENDWRMESDLIAFDFSDVSEEGGLRRLSYYLVLAAIQREAFRQARSRRRIVVVDEFKVLSQEPMLAEQVAKMYKTLRTTGVGVWAMEQDIQTLVGLSGVSASVNPEEYARLKAGASIMNNAIFTLALAHNQGSAQMLQSIYPILHADNLGDLYSLRPDEVDSDKGRGLFITPNAVYPIHIQPTQYELALLGGS